MKTLTWLILLAVLLSYIGAVWLFGFTGPVALALHFGRVSIAVAVLILYLPHITSIFNEVPPPRRDYLLAGIILTWLSGVSFSLWNEMGRVLQVDTSIFSSPIAGTFSLLLLTGGVFHLIAPDTGGARPRIIALVIGILVAIGVVLVAPHFR